MNKRGGLILVIGIVVVVIIVAVVVFFALNKSDTETPKGESRVDVGDININSGSDDDSSLTGDGMFSEKECSSLFDCRSDDFYRSCVLGLCANPTQELKTYIEENYDTVNCQSITCENCEAGYLKATGFSSGNDLSVTYCIECDSDGSHAACNEGYVCEMGRCVSE
jgi:hypothetical protein